MTTERAYILRDQEPWRRARAWVILRFVHRTQLLDLRQLPLPRLPKCWSRAKRKAAQARRQPGHVGWAQRLDGTTVLAKRDVRGRVIALLPAPEAPPPLLYSR